MEIREIVEKLYKQINNKKMLIYANSLTLYSMGGNTKIFTGKMNILYINIFHSRLFSKYLHNVFDM